jgi:hypothetical protein
MDPPSILLEKGLMAAGLQTERYFTASAPQMFMAN